MILTLEILSRSPLGPCNSSASDARNGRLRWFLLHFVQSLLPRRYRHSADAVLPARYQHVFLVDVCPAIRSKLPSQHLNQAHSKNKLCSFAYLAQPLLRELPASNILHRSIGPLGLTVCSDASRQSSISFMDATSQPA
ncbi:uncharacterized protein LOC142766923 isoform X2 [Rhipicephalus microplus]|uniref:uncharacterized protein LOC142766923 isoform X2 n=1 Tax=Rhipicephalus microplus TaxID=6941 RepID=UPI003F6B306D